MDEREKEEFEEMKAASECMARGLLATHRSVVLLTSRLNEVCAEANAIEEQITEIVTHSILRHNISEIAFDEAKSGKEHHIKIIDVLSAVLGASPKIIAEASSPAELVEKLIRQAGDTAARAAEASIDERERLWAAARDQYEIAAAITRIPTQKELLQQQSEECHKNLIEARMNRRNKN